MINTGAIIEYMVTTMHQRKVAALDVPDAVQPLADKRKKKKLLPGSPLAAVLGAGTMVALGLRHGIASDAQTAAATSAMSRFNPEFFARLPITPDGTSS